MPFRKLLAAITDRLPFLPGADGAQFGAIPYRIVDGQPQFLMITSRRSANWVFPKGSPIKGLTATETAAQEAYEEAGVRGKIEAEAIGTYLHPRNKNAQKMMRVELFALCVEEELDDWPECTQRHRQWVLLPQVKRFMASPHAARAAVELSRRLSKGA